MKFAVVIATRNRHAALSKLLTDIKNSETRPDQRIIVSSGDPLSRETLEIVGATRVSHLHLVEGGQIAQKKSGIELVQDDIDWVIFLDDDVRISSKLLSQFKNEVKNLESRYINSIGGVGFRIPETSRITQRNYVHKLVARIFLLDSPRRGKVLLSGHPTSYMESNLRMRTEWLTGISAWKKDLLSEYGSKFQHTSYAAMEDVFFSYKVSSSSILEYIPELRVDFQIEYITNLNTARIYSLTSIWTYFLVRESPKLSMTLFLYSQIGRSAHFIFSRKVRLNFHEKCSLVSFVNYSILTNLARKQDFGSLLEKIETSKWLAA